MTRKIGVGGHLSAEEGEAMLGFLAQRLPSREIAKRLGCNKQTVSDWRTRIRNGLTSRNSISRPTIAQLCLVNECHEPAAIGKYCEDHQHTPGKHAHDSRIPLARLMGSR